MFALTSETFCRIARTVLSSDSLPVSDILNSFRFRSTCDGRDGPCTFELRTNAFCFSSSMTGSGFLRVLLEFVAAIWTALSCRGTNRGVAPLTLKSFISGVSELFVAEEVGTISEMDELTVVEGDDDFLPVVHIFGCWSVTCEDNDEFLPVCGTFGCGTVAGNGVWLWWMSETNWCERVIGCGARGGTGGGWKDGGNAAGWCGASLHLTSGNMWHGGSNRTGRCSTGGGGSAGK